MKKRYKYESVTGKIYYIHRLSNGQWVSLEREKLLTRIAHSEAFKKIIIWLDAAIVAWFIFFFIIRLLRGQYAAY